MGRSLFLIVFVLGCAAEPPEPAAAPPPRAMPDGYELPEGIASDTGFVALDVEYTAVLPGGEEQQVPDVSLNGAPIKIADAMAGAQQQLDQSRADIRAAYEAAKAGGVDEVVLLQGVPGHAPNEGANASDVQILLTPDEPTAVTTHNVCSNLILSCAERSGSFDACVDAAPVCRHAEPWTVGEDCCPKQCGDDYRLRRQRGKVFLDAFMATFVRDWSCFPGMPSQTPEPK
jgi:hypothetical protein